jgi:hypothetical protein
VPEPGLAARPANVLATVNAEGRRLLGSVAVPAPGVAPVSEVVPIHVWMVITLLP